LAHLLVVSDPVQAFASSLSPSEACRACNVIGKSQTTHLRYLVRQLADPEFRGRYAASDGLCLPHLRSALAAAKDEETARYLVEASVAQVNSLVVNLEEYVRKQSWSNRHEPKYPWEQASWLRAVAFFAGEAPPAEGDEVYQLRQQALADYHIRVDRQTEGPQQDAIQREPNPPTGRTVGPSEKSAHA
jgi:hypothetical protein